MEKWQIKTIINYGGIVLYSKWPKVVYFTWPKLLHFY